MAPTAKTEKPKPAAGKADKKPSKDKKLPAVPESKLKDAKRKLSSKSKLIQRKRLITSKVNLRRRQNLKRAEKYARSYLKMNRDVIEKARAAKKAGNIYIPAEPKVAFVIRIRG
jgi:large subunit ribosomal protein L7e